MQLTIDTVARAIRRINLRRDRIAPRQVRQGIRKRFPFLRLKAEAKEEGRFTLSIRVAQQISDNLRFIDTQPIRVGQFHGQLGKWNELMKLYFMLCVARPARFVPTPATMTRTRLPRVCA